MSHTQEGYVFTLLTDIPGFSRGYLRTEQLRSFHYEVDHPRKEPKGTKHYFGASFWGLALLEGSSGCGVPR